MAFFSFPVTAPKNLSFFLLFIYFLMRWDEITSWLRKACLTSVNSEGLFWHNQLLAVSPQCRKEAILTGWSPLVTIQTKKSLISLVSLTVSTLQKRFSTSMIKKISLSIACIPEKVVKCPSNLNDVLPPTDKACTAVFPYHTVAIR